MRTASIYAQQVSDILVVAVNKDTSKEPTMFRMGIAKDGDEPKTIYEGTRESCIKVLEALKTSLEEANNDIYQGGQSDGSKV